MTLRYASQNVLHDHLQYCVVIYCQIKLYRLYILQKGKLKEYLLGKSLRKRYNNFLGSYVSSVVEGRSTYMNRTKASLELVLAGLFPPSEEEMFYKGLRWQPIPYTAVARNSDPVIRYNTYLYLFKYSIKNDKYKIQYMHVPTIPYMLCMYEYIQCGN